MSDQRDSAKLWVKKPCSKQQDSMIRWRLSILLVRVTAPTLSRESHSAEALASVSDIKRAEDRCQELRLLQFHWSDGTES